MEQLVNVAVQAQLPVHIETVPLDKALEINNLRAVFGERYPDPVRPAGSTPSPTRPRPQPNPDPSPDPNPNSESRRVRP